MALTGPGRSWWEWTPNQNRPKWQNHNTVASNVKHVSNWKLHLQQSGGDLISRFSRFLKTVSHVSCKVETKWSRCWFCVTKFNPVLSVLSSAGVVWLPVGRHGEVDTAGTNSPASVFSHILCCFFSPLTFSFTTLFSQRTPDYKERFGPKHENYTYTLGTDEEAQASVQITDVAF